MANIATVVAFGAESTGTAVGNPIAISDLSLDFNSQEHNTTGRYGENNNDPDVMRGAPTLNCGTFIQAQGQPTLMPGDYVALSVAMKVTSTSAVPAPAPLSRWVIGKNSIATTGPNKFSLNLIFDRINSDPNLNLF